MKRSLRVLIPAAVLAGALWYGFFTHQAPSGQPALAALDSAMALALLRADFNRAVDRGRLILLLSPT